MRAPPPLTKFLQFPITAGIGLMAIALTIITLAGRSIDPLAMSVLAFEGEPWRLLTSALIHGSLIHLLFNVIWQWIFGTALETTWGVLRTLAIIIFLAVGSTLAEYALTTGGIGLSGVGYGMFGLLAILSRRDRRFADTVDNGTIRLFVIWGLVCVALTYANVLNIGNVAHASGAALGLLLGLVIAGRSLVVRIASALGIAVFFVAAVLGATIYRPIVNLSKDGGIDSARIAYDLLVENKNEEAIRYLKRTLELSPTYKQSTYNLGLAHERLGQMPEAIDAYRRAYNLDKTEEKHRGALADATGTYGITRAKAGDYRGAVPFYKESIALDPNEKTNWFNLSLAHSKLAESAAALETARKAHALDTQSSANKVPSEDYADRLAFALEDAGAEAEQRGELEQAVTLYREAIAISESQGLYVRLASVLLRLGRSDESQEALSKGLKVDAEE